MPLAHIWQAVAALLFALFLPLPLTAAPALQAVPALTARLIDQTNTFTAEQAAAIEARLHEIEAKSGSQVVVLMIPSTGVEDIAPYAHRVASTWKIGREDVGDGLLIVVAKDDRRMRIEVARALEGAIPDLAASRIIEQQMAPNFRQGDYADGILAALDQIGARIADEDLPEPTTTSQSAPEDSGNWLPQLGMFWLVFVMIFASILRSLLGRVLGSLVMSVGIFGFIFWISHDWISALIAAVIALLFMLLSNGGSGHGGGHSSGRSRGHRSSSSSSRRSGGGFRSGGGGSFGGGGASGRW